MNKVIKHLEENLRTTREGIEMGVDDCNRYHQLIDSRERQLRDAREMEADLAAAIATLKEAEYKGAMEGMAYGSDG